MDTCSEGFQFLLVQFKLQLKIKSSLASIASLQSTCTNKFTVYSGDQGEVRKKICIYGACGMPS